MTPQTAALLLKAWKEKLAERQPSPSERQIMDRYQDIVDGIRLYDPTKEPDADDDI
jgi:hypothetical protein